MQNMVNNANDLDGNLLTFGVEYCIIGFTNVEEEYILWQKQKTWLLQEIIRERQ